VKRTPLKPVRAKPRRPRPAVFDLGPPAKTAQFLDLLQTLPRRKMGNRLVYLPEDGRPFIVIKGVNGKPRRKTGELRTCQKCGREYFWRSGARPEQAFCSRECGGEQSRRTRHANAMARSMASGGPKKSVLDMWFSLIVRSVGHCQSCGTTERLQCAHVVSRRYLGVRYDLRNAMCLCAACHMRFTHRPLEWEVFVTERMGEAAYIGLKRRALAFRGPLNRAATAQRLYAIAEERGLSLGMFPGWPGWVGLTEPDAKETA
jgi:5-methylcytosine-specific restriction endonuclease McrA